MSVLYVQLQLKNILLKSIESTKNWWKILMKNPDEIQRLSEEHFTYDEISEGKNSEDDIGWDEK